MPKKRIKKIRGSRTCGGGSHKKRRGAGHRGGRGNAGVHKHKYIRFLKLAKEGKYEFGKHGFTRPKILTAEYLLEKELKDVLGELRESGKIDEYTYKYFLSRKDLNVGDLDAIADRLVELGIASKEGDVYSIDLAQLGYQKLLGAGKISKAMQIKVPYATPNAVAKIEEAGGSVITEFEAEFE
jgi:large subunit ribosomal protein L15